MVPRRVRDANDCGEIFNDFAYELIVLSGMYVLIFTVLRFSAVQ